MKNALMGLSLLRDMMSNHNLKWLEKIKQVRVGYHVAKGYSSRKRFKYNKRRGL